MIRNAAPWLGLVAVLAIAAGGAYVVAIVDRLVAGVVAGCGLAFRDALSAPWRTAALLLVQQRTRTERPDAPAWAFAPALYAALVAGALVVVPLSATFSVADFRAGIVAWGALETLVIVAVFLNGWSPNSLFGLIGAYRFVAVGLSYLLLSMFVLIAAAIPAESLQLTRIVASQHGLWNVARQPLGFVLFLIVALGASFWGPLNVADSDDLASGTSAEASGTARLVWELARAAMLVAFSLMTTTVFLGGWFGPWLPGALWIAVKSLAVLVALVGARHVWARVNTERFVLGAWTVLLPLAFVDLVITGLESLR